MLEIIGEIEDLTEVYTGITDAQEDIEILINSPGGSAFEAIQLVNAIENTEHYVTAKVEVQAMSAAAVIALGCDHVEMDSKAIVMLHNCWTIAMGNAKELEQQAEACHAVDNALQMIVTKNCTEENANYIKQKMEDGELWLTGAQAAELFENVELVEKPAKQGLLAAAGSLCDLVAKVQDLETKLAEATQPAPAPEPEPVPEPVAEYIVTDELKALLATELE